MGNIQTTTLLITDKQHSVIGKFDGVKIANKVYDVLVGRSRDPHVHLEDINNLSGSTNIVFQKMNEDGTIHDLELPEDISIGITNYFQNSKNISNTSDCLGFIVEILGGKRGDRYLDDGNHNYLGVTQIYNSKSLTTGDVIVMLSSMVDGYKKGLYHYSLYIGNDLYISKLGANGVLAITNTEQLKKLYPKLNLMFKIELEKK